jgi:hypothetical protein
MRAAGSPVFCAETMATHELESMYVQQNCSTTHARNHSRIALPVATVCEAKIRCTRGAIYDVVVDLRLGLPTFCAGTVRLAADPPHDVRAARLRTRVPGLEDDVEVTYPVPAGIRRRTNAASVTTTLRSKDA